MSRDELTQLVVFRTELPVEQFVQSWRPVASRFLGSGLETITLAAFDRRTSGGVAFISRNTWPAAAYRRAFPGGLAADGAGGPVTVQQAGVFTVHPASPEPVAAARPDDDLALALLTVDDAAGVDAVAVETLAAMEADRLGQAVVYVGVHEAQRVQVAVSVHGPAGGGVRSISSLRAVSETCGVGDASVFLTGRELLSLTP